jgi:beta-N-acetylhexosaminidase
MTDRAIAQQLVVFGASGADPGRTNADALGDSCVGGVFVTRNVGNWQPGGSLEAAADAIDVIVQASTSCVAPPFITTDAEPGTRVLKVPVDPLPTPAVLEDAFVDDPDGALLAELADGFASDLSGAGVHVNLGVIVDVDAGPGFYMDREGRSFGGDPLVVDVLGRALVEGHCRAGVAPTLKHFPNQGSTVEDPHREDSFSVNGFDTWLDVGAVPYLATDAPLVMTGHIRYDGVDDGLPASLSEEITTGWLRETLGFDGVVITDDLHTMQGVAQFAPDERGVTAIAAGADLALYVATDDAAGVVGAIETRMREDAAFAARARDSAARVLRLKAALGLLPDVDPALFALCGDSGE